MTAREKDLEQTMDHIYDRLPEDVRELINQWNDDPCWDLETSDGYEIYSNSLRIYANARDELNQVHARRKEKQELESFVNEFNLRQAWAKNTDVNSNGLFELLFKMTQRIEELEDKVHELEMR